jgi:hypothetical protein
MLVLLATDDGARHAPRSAHEANVSAISVILTILFVFIGAPAGGAISILLAVFNSKSHRGPDGTELGGHSHSSR